MILTYLKIHQNSRLLLYYVIVIRSHKQIRKIIVTTIRSLKTVRHFLCLQKPIWKWDLYQESTESINTMLRRRSRYVSRALNSKTYNGGSCSSKDNNVSFYIMFTMFTPHKTKKKSRPNILTILGVLFHPKACYVKK